MGWNGDPALRGRDQRRRIALQQIFAPEVPDKRPDRRELARRRRSGNTVPVKIGEKPPDGRDVDVGRAQLLQGTVRRVRHAPQKLREVTLVGGHGVPRRIAIQQEKRQKGVEDVFHAGLGELKSVDSGNRSAVPTFGSAESHSARSRSARSDIASFRFCLSRTRSVGGAMIPNVMLVG
jgi:hypothetical protein